MAGIGFELRKLLKRDTLIGLFQAYAYAGIISSGPWVLSIVGLLIIGLLSIAVVIPAVQVQQFQVSVTYLIAFSLILTGLAQLAFTRFVSDQVFSKRDELVLPNYTALTLVVTVISGLLGAAAVIFLFTGESVVYRLLMLAGFVLMSNIWIATIFLSGLKQYREIVFAYLIGYGISVVAALALRRLGLEGLLMGYVIGQVVLFVGMLSLVLRNHRAKQFMSFEMFRRGGVFGSLVLIGLFYNLGVWIDKFMFWSFDATSEAVIGPLRASLIYDLPVFLAYLSIIPGMAVFLVRLETDFVEHYDAFYDAVRSGGSLAAIERSRNGMVETVRLGLSEIARIQAIAALVVFVIGEQVLKALDISELFLPLLYIDTIAAGLQVVFLGILNVMFYLDRRRAVLALTGMFVLLNFAFTALTLTLGPAYYGYGFAGALLIVVLIGLANLDRTLDRLEFETFMLQT